MALTALVLWIATALVGGYMLGITLRTGRPQSDADRSKLPTSVLLAHPTLALASLVVWVIYMAEGSPALAWVAFVGLVLVATLGDVMVFRWLKERKKSTEPSASPVAEQQIPPAAVVTHGVLAVSTIVLVFLTALGVGQ